MPDLPPSSAPSNPKPAGELTFLTFLRGLANEALIQFGVIPHPLTGVREANLPYARATIRVLEQLQEKTKRNLTAEEDDYLRTVLDSLNQRLAKIEPATAAPQPSSTKPAP